MIVPVAFFGYHWTAEILSGCGKRMARWTGGCRLYGLALGLGKDQRRRQASLVDAAWFGGRKTGCVSDIEMHIQTRTVEGMGGSEKAFEVLRQEWPLRRSAL